jgi:oligogalacturonide transporter
VDELMKKVNTIWTKLSYACGDIYGGGAFLLVGVLYLNFLTDVAHISPAVAGSIFLIGKFWDAVSDPLMGVISDRTKSKYGRRRFYFLIGIIPIFISFSMLWFSLKTDSQITLYLYYLVSYLFFNTSITLVMIPYNSILPAMTKDYKERTSFITVRLMFSNVAAVISGVLPMIIISSFGENMKLGYAVMGMLFGLFYALPYILLFTGTYENDYDHESELEAMTFAKFMNEFKTVFLNKSFRVYSGFFISAQIAVDFIITLFIYYLTYSLDMKDMFSLVLGVLLIVQVISMPIHMKISNKYGKIAPLKVGLPVWIIALIISLFITASSSTVFIFIIAVFSGFGCSASIFVPWSIFPELADIDELITNRRREGIYSGLSTLIRKISQAIAIFLIGVTLDLIGYVPNIAQSDFTLTGIKIMFGIVPIFFIFIALYYSKKFKLTESKYEVIKSEIVRRNNNNKEVATDETMKICEELTGISYQKLGTY